MKFCFRQENADERGGCDRVIDREAKHEVVLGNSPGVDPNELRLIANQTARPQVERMSHYAVRYDAGDVFLLSLDGGDWSIELLGPTIWASGVYLFGNEGTAPVHGTSTNNGCSRNGKWIGPAGNSTDMGMMGNHFSALVLEFIGKLQATSLHNDH